MNFLAHIYLSGNNDQIKLGNFIGDYVKGNKFLDFPKDIQTGIILHRHIDSFTDKNEIPKQLKELLYPLYRRYYGIVIDLFYDHFLANNWNYFSDILLEDFVNDFYVLLQQNIEILPYRVQNFLPHMIAHNRLLSYRKISGIKHALSIMVRTTSLPDETDDAIKILESQYDHFNDNFLEFFPLLIDHVRHRYSIDLQYSFDSQL